MAAKRDKFKISAMGTAIHDTTIRGITAVDDLFNVFHDNRSWFYIVFNYFIIISEHFLYHIHEIIMKQSRAESKPFPLKIEGQGSGDAVGIFLWNEMEINGRGKGNAFK